MVLLVVAVLGAVATMSLRARLSASGGRVDFAGARIEALLSRRAESVPDLIEVIEAHRAGEDEILRGLTRARHALVAARTPHEVAGADNQLSGALASALALAGANATVLAEGSFQNARDTVEATEPELVEARHAYNDAVNAHNALVTSPPTSLLAGPLGFIEQDYFEVGGGAHGPLDVQF